MDSHSVNTIEKEAINVGDKKSIKDAFRSLIIEYCSNSTVHGVKYLSCKRRTLFEKIWWIATFLLSTFVCWWLIHNIYRKWQEMPVMVSIAEKPMMVWEIPFPAVTICPETKALSQYLNFNEVYEKILSYTEKYNDTDELNGTIHRNIDEVMFDQYLALSQICFRNHRFVLPLKLKTDPNCVEMLRNVSMPIRSMMKSCYFQEAECAEDFLETITDDGVCLTFNSLSVGDLLRVDQLHRNYEHMSGSHEVSHWTLEKGYPDIRLTDRYPKPVGDAFLGLDIILHLPEYIEDECRVFYMDKFAVTPIGFTVMLHSPNEYPSGSSYYIAIPLDYQVQLVVQPLMMTTSDGLRSYNVENRQCFYNHERYLRFFKEYTQQNCEMECISNYTLHKCGCVKFWMMRDNHTDVCGTSMINCYTEARYEIMKQHAKQLKEFIIDEARIFKSGATVYRHVPHCSTKPKFYRKPVHYDKA